jgi:predicted extracellular nuclease
MRRFIIALILLLPIFLYSGQTSIYEVQYTGIPGTDGTYPSPLRNQIVTISGIVTAINHSNGGFYLSDPEGGPWRGIYINERSREVSVGDYVQLTGEVSEQFGLTTLRNIRMLEIIESDKPLPPATLVTTGELAVSEAYEGVLVQVINVKIINRSEQGSVLLINDGTGVCRMSDSFLSAFPENLSGTAGQAINRIIGVVDYRFGEYRLNPRQGSDIHSSPLGSSKPSWGRIKSYYR